MNAIIKEKTRTAAKVGFLKAALIVFALSAITIAAGCTTELSDPLDLNSLRYEYTIVSDSDGEYIILTNYTASETDIQIPDSIYDVPVREIGESVFEGDWWIESVSIGSNITAVGKNAFKDCTSLVSATYYPSLTSLGEGAFYGCTSLGSFALDVSASDLAEDEAAAEFSIGDAAFYECTALTNAELAENTVSIGSYAFSGCTALTGIDLPSGLDSIGRGAFYGCSALADIEIPSGVSEMGGRALSGTAWLKAIGRNYVIVGDGILIQYNGEVNVPTLPSNVRVIAGAFAGNTTITGVVLNDGLEEIGDMAFCGCTSLKSMDVSGVTAIGSQAFSGCTSLASVLNISSVQSVSSDAFEYCDLLS